MVTMNKPLTLFRMNGSLCLSLKQLTEEADLKEVSHIMMVDTSIRRLILREFCEADLEKYQPLFKGISQNKSIETIELRDFDVCGELYGALFGTNILKLRFVRCNITIDIFAVASKTKRYLPYISFDSCMFMQNEYDKPTKRAKLESRDEGIRNKTLFGYKIHVETLLIVDKREQNEQDLRFVSALPNISLRKLHLSGVHIDANAARALTHGISQNKTIEILELENLATEHVFSLMVSCLDLTSSLKTLKLWDNRNGYVSDNVMSTLANALANDSTLEELEFLRCTGVTSMGWLELSRALGSSRSSLKKLEIWETSIDNSVITAFGNDFSRNTSLEVLDISCNRHRPITSESWLVFSRLFGSNLSNLREIDVSGNGIDHDVIIAYFNELSGNENSLLKRFISRSEADDEGIDPPIDPTDDIWDPITNLLCNTSSIDATWSSNHTLCSLGGFDVEESDSDGDEESDTDSDHIESYTMPREVYDLLEMNEDDDKKQVARRKLMKYHFSGDFDLNALIGSDQKLLPRKISWFGRDALGQSIVYSIMRKLPDLCQN